MTIDFISRFHDKHFPSNLILGDARDQFLDYQGELGLVNQANHFSRPATFRLFHLKKTINA